MRGPLIDQTRLDIRDTAHDRVTESSSRTVTIAVNAEFLANGRPDGIPRAAFGLVRAMAEEDQSVNWILFTPRIEWQAAAGELRMLANCRVEVAGSLPGRTGRVIWRLFQLPWLVRQHHVNALFNPVGNGPAWMPRRIPLVITIHDLAWLNGDRWYSLRYRLAQRLLTGRAVQLAARVFAVSAYSAKQIQIRLSVASRRITIVRNGLMTPRAENVLRADMDGPVLDHEKGRPMALFVGTRIRRKNLLGVLRAFKRIRAETSLDVQLSIVGASRDSRTLSPDVKGDTNVQFYGYVDDRRLEALYREATFLIFPSFEEGFGFPVLESMALGTPVITSATSALAEVAGDAAILVDPYDNEQIYCAMLKLFSDARLRSALRERGLARAACFSWEEPARVALSDLRSLALEANAQLT